MACTGVVTFAASTAAIGWLHMRHANRPDRFVASEAHHSSRLARAVASTKGTRRQPHLGPARSAVGHGVSLMDKRMSLKNYSSSDLLSCHNGIGSINQAQGVGSLQV